MAMLTAQFADLLTDGFRAIIDETIYERWAAVYTQVYNVHTSNKPDENDSEITGFGLMPVKTENAPITYDDPLQAFDTTYTHLTYALGFEVSEEMVEDDQYRKVNGLPSQLGQSLIETVETSTANDWNRAFNSSYTGGDGIELLATNHPLRGGGTFQNELTNAADLSATSLEQAFIDINSWVDHRGKKRRAMPDTLLYPVDLDWTVKRLFQSTLDPDTAQNAVNPAKGSLSRFIMNPYLTDTDAWFILCKGHFMNFFWRRMPRNGRDNDFNTGALRHKLDCRFSHGWSSPFNVFGSPGA